MLVTRKVEQKKVFASSEKKHVKQKYFFFRNSEKREQTLCGDSFPQVQKQIYVIVASTAEWGWGATV